MLFDTLLQLSGLVYLKYNFSGGMIVKVHINLDQIFNEGQDVVILVESDHLFEVGLGVGDRGEYSFDEENNDNDEGGEDICD